MTQPVMGLSEIRALLNVSRQRADQIIRKPGFPAPVAELAMGKVWDTDAVEEWAKAVGRIDELGEARYLAAGRPRHAAEPEGK